MSAALLGYLGLFAAAYVAATLIPTSSEAVLAGLMIDGRFDWRALLAVALVGNVLGALTNWAIGRWIAFKGYGRGRIAPEKLGRAEAWMARYGMWSLLLSWLPVIGDPLTLVAGLSRLSFWRFIVPTTIGKAARYAAIVAATAPFAGAG